MRKARVVTFAGSPVQKAALLAGLAFLLVGILGFVPGVTTGVDQMRFASHDSGALLFGVFQVSILHNIVHLLFGVAGIAFASRFSASRNYLVWGGAIYLLLWIYGLIIPHDSAANIVPLNSADNWLHLGLGVVMVVLGLTLAKSDRVASGPPTEAPK